MYVRLMSRADVMQNWAQSSPPGTEDRCTPDVSCACSDLSVLPTYYPYTPHAGLSVGADAVAGPHLKGLVAAGEVSGWRDRGGQLYETAPAVLWLHMPPAVLPLLGTVQWDLAAY
jgi:hypothetical protein